MEATIVRFKVSGHVPQTGTSYDAGAVAEVPGSWAANELPRGTIEAATQADLDAYRKSLEPTDKKSAKPPKE